MVFCFLVLWILAVNSCVLCAERQDFKLDDYEVESSKWKNPHSDIFSVSDEPIKDEMFDLLGTAKGAVECDKLHAVVEACQARILSLGQKVRNTDIHIQRLAKHLVKIYDESMSQHEGVILMKMTPDDLKTLKTFADDGKFSSQTHNNIHDLLRVTFAVPSKLMLERILPMMNIFVWIPKMIWDFALNVFQGGRLLLMEIVFSPDIAIYASMILPVVVFFHSLWRGHSIGAMVLRTGGAVMAIAYFVGLKSSFETARAKDMARMIRARHMPPECKYEEMGYLDWATSGIRSLITGVDRCEKYFLDQAPESPVEPSVVFWKLFFTPFTVAMDTFGVGLSQFISNFSKELGWVGAIFGIPVGILAVLYFLGILLAFVSGGSLNLPLFGRVSFWNPVARRSVFDSTDTSPPLAPAIQPTVSNQYNFHFFGSSDPSSSQAICPPGLNMNISTPEGPILQLTSGPSQEINNSSPPNENIGAESMLTAAEPETKHDTREAEPHRQIAVFPQRSHNNALTPAVSSREQQLTTSFSETSENIPRHPSLVLAYSENDDHNYSSDSRSLFSNYCALKENGSGDFMPRDFSYRMLPSNVLRRRKHYRKFSL